MGHMTDEALLEKLNAFTRRAHSLDEVYLFDLILCDNEIDRDGDCFSKEALLSLQERFVGVTGIFDHNPRCGNQNARIFHTELMEDNTRKTAYGQPYLYLKANAYMIRTESNQDLIREIEGGIKKEVSISCAASQQICSICGANRLQKNCGHIKGRSYGGALCYRVLDGITDAYEWSFVAVPAQKNAGVTKTMGGKLLDAERQQLYDALEQANASLDVLTEALRREVVKLCYKEGDSICARMLAESTIHMDADALLSLKKSLELLKPAAQPPIDHKASSHADPASKGIRAFSMQGKRGEAHR
ncbi:MAG: hypothetical protein IKM30_00980 [Oscillospiraceae bacterium]|nr:hypothetical protein [Oscillospiraceae bacterium]